MFLSTNHEQLLRGASPENGVVAAASKNLMINSALLLASDTQPRGKFPGKNYLLNIAEPWRWLRTEVGRKVEKEEEEEEEMEDPPTWKV